MSRRVRCNQWVGSRAMPSAGRNWSPPHIRLTTTIGQSWLSGACTSVWIPRLLLKPPSSSCARHRLQPSPPLAQSFLLAAAAYKVALFVHSIAAPSTSKCYKVEGRQATSEVQSDEVVQAKQTINTHGPVDYHNRLYMQMQHKSGAALLVH